MDNRIVGQQVTLRVINQGALVANIPMLDGKYKMLLEKKSEDYIGENTTRYDSVFKGVEGSANVHIEGNDWFVFQNAMRTKYLKRQAGAIVNIAGKFTFPDGTTVKVLLKDVDFGDIDNDIPKRDDYFKGALSFSGSDVEHIT